MNTHYTHIHTLCIHIIHENDDAVNASRVEKTVALVLCQQQHPRS